MYGWEKGGVTQANIQLIKVIIHIIGLPGACIHLAILAKMLVVLAFPLGHASSGGSLRRGFGGVCECDLCVRSGFVALSHRNCSGGTLFLVGSSGMHCCLLL